MTDSEVLAQLVKLQKIDSAILAIEDSKTEFTRKISEIKALVDANTAEFNGKKTKLNDARKKKAAIDVEIKTKEADIKNKENQSGSVKTNDAFKALQNEIDSMKRDIRKFEDQQIVLMEEEETANTWVKTQEKSMKETEVKLLAEIKSLEAEAGNRDSLIAAEMTKREEQVKLTDSVWYLRYEKVRKSKGLAMAPILEGKNGSGVCGGCKFEVRPQHIIELKKGNTIKTCENCARMMYVVSNEEVVK